MLRQILVEEHAVVLPALETAVNNMMTNRGQQTGYRVPMKYPNRLDEFLNSKGMRNQELAALLGTSKQNIFNWRRGIRKLSIPIAKQIQDAIGVPWPLILGWTGEVPEEPPDRERVLQSIGTRIAWARAYRELDIAEAAKRFGLSTARLEAIENGEAEPGMVDLTTIVAKLKMPADFLLMGDSAELSEKVAQAWEAYIKGLQSVPQQNKG